jgi:L-aspartate oxidase
MNAIAETIETHFVVVGSGIAGLWTALHLSEHGSVALVTKSALTESNTEYAQGGIAVALLPADSPGEHKADTLAAGAGLCDDEAVDVLTREGPAVVRELIDIGARFDKRDGHYVVGREAAHGRHRIIHAQGDATGAEVERAAVAAVRQRPNISIHEQITITDILQLDGQCVGIEAIGAQDGRRVRFIGSATVLATGGAGSLYRVTTNPAVATADGFAVAWRADADLQDLEFVQFHPTALADDSFPKFLVSEAVRGEGAIMRNADGVAFMEAYHPLGDLAPRDVVSRAVDSEMRRSGSPHVYLDLSPIAEKVEARFPGIVSELRERGFTVPGDMIPITPAAHYMMGGIRTDIQARTRIPRLYACGECASLGVHGANRLASNSLLDGLVYGARASRAVVVGNGGELTPAQLEAARRLPPLPFHVADPACCDEVRRIMWAQVGIIRDESGLADAKVHLRAMCSEIERAETASPDAVIAAGMVQAARLVTAAALARTESRGAHYRTDYPDTDDVNWRKHIVVRKGPQGRIEIELVPVETG